MHKVSVFKNAKEKKACYETDFFDLCKVMQKNALPQLQFYLDNLYNGITLNAIGESYKTLIPCFTYAGTFTERNDKSIKESAFIMILDIDNISKIEVVPKTNILTTNQKNEIQKLRFERLNEVLALKKRILENENIKMYLASVFVSPSENGLKVAFKVDFGTNQYEYKKLYESLVTWFCEHTNIPKTTESKGFGIDAKCSNISRLCFLSFDKDIYINENAIMLDNLLDNEDFYLSMQNHKETEKPRKDVILTPLRPLSEPRPKDTKEITEFEMFGDILKGYEKRKNDSFYSGNRQNYIFNVSCVLCRYGIYYNVAKTLLVSKFSESDFVANEIEKTCYKAYKSAINEFGKYKYTKKF